MLRGLLMTLTLCLAGAICAPTQAAQVVFAGNITRTTKSAGNWSYATGIAALSNVGFGVPGGVAFVPTAATNAALKIGTDVYNVTLTGTTVEVDSTGSFETVTAEFGGGTSGTKTLTLGTLTWTSNVPVGLGLGNNNTNNWQAIYNAATFPRAGVNIGGFTINDSAGGFATTQNYSFIGNAVPEPGSIALLSGLGLVFGAARRRRQARATAV